MSDKNIYEKNIEALKDKYTEIYDEIKKCNGDNVYIDKSVNGEDILAVKKEGRLYYLNSRYCDDECADTWVKQYENVSYQAVFIIFGLSNFRYVEKLLEVTEDTNPILLYEPDKEIFAKSIEIVDITDIIQRDNVILCVNGCNNNYLTEFNLFALSYSIISLTQYCCMPNYDNLYPVEWKNLIKDIKERFDIIIMSRNTEILFSNEIITNMLYNCEDMISQYSFNQLIRAYKEVDNLQEIPIIIVAAGPSLDKNIEDLKMAAGKCVILAVDTALKTLLNHNIKPDMVITIDSHKPPVLFMHSQFSDIPMLVCSNSNKDILTIHSGKRFYFDDSGSYMSYLYDSVAGEKIQPTETGGSVANNAFSAAQVLGFKKIIMIGQDLAYPNNKMHTNDAYGGTKTDEINENNKYFEVEDVFGGKVLTESNMDLYRKWFENQIVRYNDLKVIDATEGGAKIQGSEVMTLKEAIERECKLDIDSKEIIDKISPAFNDEEREKLLNKVNSIPQELDIAKKRIKKGIRDYEKLYELSRKGKGGTKEFSDLIKRIDEITEYVEKEAVLQLASIYNRVDEYETLSKVYQVKDNFNDEIKDIMSQGVKMLESYIKGIHMLKKDIEDKGKKDIEVIKDNVGQLKEIINSILDNVKNEDSISVNERMKEYYQYVVNLMSQLILKEHTTKDEELYKKMRESLDKVVLCYEKKEYFKMSEILKGEFMQILDEVIA